MADFVFRDKFLPFGNKTYIMGILNVTPDSFSDGGKYFSLNDALKRTEIMIEEGADIIDVGAVSTRPFSESVSTEQEWERLCPVLKEIKKNFSVPVSVDTFVPANICRSLEAGADIINDVSGVFLSETAEYIKEYNAGWIIMHGGVALRKAEEKVHYENGIINDVNSFFDGMLEKITDCGIPLENICLDAGFGFSKTTEQNTVLLENYDKINKRSLPLLCALSRKRFIGEISGEEDSEKRDRATLAANIIACTKGADIIRVHNVALHRKAVPFIDSVCRI